MKRLSLLIVFLFGVLASAAGAAALPAGSVCEATPQVFWEKSGIGKLSAELLLAPNGNLLLPQGNQLKSVSPEGKELWNFKVPGGGARGLALSGAGAIFYPSSSSVQEIKVNGARGWKFSIFGAGKKSKGALAAWGPSGHIYLPLGSGLYILDQAGCCVAKLSPWESNDLATKVPIYFNALACIADETACYVVYSDDKAGYWIAAVNNQGQLLWRYWLGDLKDAYLLQENGGKVYAVTSLKKGGQGKKKDKGRVYAFDSRNGRQPLWKAAINCDRIAGAALSATGTLYLTVEGRIYALDSGNGKTLWEKQFLNVASPPAVDPGSGCLYLGCSDGRLIAVDQNARLCWSLTLEGAITRAPLIAPDRCLYAATDKGKLYKIAIAGR